MSLKAFKEWIAKSEEAPTVTLKDANLNGQKRECSSKSLPGKSFYKRSPKY
jgi:hypothetical protein